MDLIEFQSKYTNYRAHDKIEILCEGGCNKIQSPLKTRAQQTIKKRGKYLCPPCGLKQKYAESPRSQETKKAIGKGVHQNRFLKLIKDLDPLVKSFEDWHLVMGEDDREGVLWALEKYGQELIIVAHLFFWNPSEKMWFWKEIDEMEGPVAISCSLRLLKKAPVVDSIWRKRVKECAKNSQDNILPEILQEWVSGQNQ